MNYRLKRALGISLALYFSTFVVGIVAGIVSGQDMSSLDTVSDSFWYVGMVAAVVLTALCTVWYFRNRAITPSAKSGFYFGGTAILLSSVLDIVFLSLGNAGGASTDVGRYYGDWRFWFIVVLVVATAKFVGWHKGRKA